MFEKPLAGRAAERRRAPRFNISLPVRFTNTQTGRVCSATVDNLSLGGMLLLTEEKLDQGAQLIIHIPAGGDATINVAASAVRTSAVGEVGVAFVSLRDDAMDRLSEFLDRRARMTD